MNRPNNTPVLVAIVVLALGGMALLNRAQYDNRPRTEAEMREEMEQAQQAAAAKSPTKTTAEAPPASSAPSTTDTTEELVSLPTTVEFGNPKGKRSVVLGYSWNPDVQADPQKTKNGLMQLRQSLEQASKQMNMDAKFQFVNTDVVRTQEPGIWLDGRFIVELDTANPSAAMPNLAQSLMGGANQPPSSTTPASSAK